MITICIETVFSPQDTCDWDESKLHEEIVEMRRAGMSTTDNPFEKRRKRVGSLNEDVVGVPTLSQVMGASDAKNVQGFNRSSHHITSSRRGGR